MNLLTYTVHSELLTYTVHSELLTYTVHIELLTYTVHSELLTYTVRTSNIEAQNIKHFVSFLQRRHAARKSGGEVWLHQFVTLHETKADQSQLM